MEHETTEVGMAVREFKLSGEVLTPMKGLGKELCDLLREKLKVPDGVINFEVRFAREEIITVRCEYMPKA